MNSRLKRNEEREKRKTVKPHPIVNETTTYHHQSQPNVHSSTQMSTACQLRAREGFGKYMSRHILPSFAVFYFELVYYHLLWTRLLSSTMNSFAIIYYEPVCCHPLWIRGMVWYHWLWIRVSRSTCRGGQRTARRPRLAPPQSPLNDNLSSQSQPHVHLSTHKSAKRQLVIRKVNQTSTYQPRWVWWVRVEAASAQLDDHVQPHPPNGLI